MSRKQRWIGIDFSGNYRMWTPGCGRSNVWIAEVRRTGSRFMLASLQRVQELEGGVHPFKRLVNMLAGGKYAAAAIDAPFSVPERYVPRGCHNALLELVGGIQLDGKRPFPEAKAFVTTVAGRPPPLEPPQPLRRTEAYWRGKRVNVRSTLWVRPRGGAAMTAACLTLLHRAGRPIWPWMKGTRDGLLVEAFPAAQLRHWGLPHQQYDNGKEKASLKRQNRKKIADGTSTRFRLGQFRGILEKNADALDSVVCAFAAIAVTTGGIAVEPNADAEVRKEGWIAVHK